MVKTTAGEWAYKMAERKYDAAVEQGTIQCEVVDDLVIFVELLKDCIENDEWDGIDHYVLSIAERSADYLNAKMEEDRQWELYEKAKKLCIKHGTWR